MSCHGGFSLSLPLGPPGRVRPDPADASTRTGPGPTSIIFCFLDGGLAAGQPRPNVGVPETQAPGDTFFRHPFLGWEKVRKGRIREDGKQWGEGEGRLEMGGGGQAQPRETHTGLPLRASSSLFSPSPHSDPASSSHILRSRRTHPRTPPGTLGNGGSVGAAEAQSGPGPSRLGLRCLRVLCT